MKATEWMHAIQNGGLDDTIRLLYGIAPQTVKRQKARLIGAIDAFCNYFPDRHGELRLFSAPGRTEISGNHTDHQNGCVLAGAVDLDVIAVVSFHTDEPDGRIRVKSEGYPEDQINGSDPDVHPEETGTSAALLRGMTTRMAQCGADIGGFDAYTTSDVLSGSGLSSSAAFEILIGTILNCGYLQGGQSAAALAKSAQYAENVYFGKNSGLMDQMACAVGGLVSIDFQNPQMPRVTPVHFHFPGAGLILCITDTKGSHADLTDEYAAVPIQMKEVAAQFGKGTLREVEEAAFYEALPKLRRVCSDRALLRAAHFFAESARAQKEATALSNGDIPQFLSLVRESGESSAALLQNLYSTKTPDQQPIPLALFLSKRMLGTSGAARVHGGGFAGTIQAFVPAAHADEYAKRMDELFGSGSCRMLNIRPVGGIELTLNAQKGAIHGAM